MKKIVVDPVTRIEGHLRIEAEAAPLPAGMHGYGQVTRASSAGTMIRGIETILKGRDPREAWAFTQRFCGVCTLVHALGAVRAVEHALDYPIPPNAHLIRNLMLGAQYVHDHVMHFYHLHAFDWVDLVSAADADPADTARLQQSLSDWPNNSPEYFAGVLQRLQGFISSGQLGIFKTAAWGHPAYRLPPHANLLAFAHYLEVLAWQREVIKLHAVFGGKNPHPNIVIGGMPCAISMTSSKRGQGKAAGKRNNKSPLFTGLTALDQDGLETVATAIRQMQALVDQMFLPDTTLIADYYKDYRPETGDFNDWTRIGEGVGNFVTFAEFQAGGVTGDDSFLIPQGAILDRDLDTVHAVDPQASEEIQEYISHSWYDSSHDKDTPLHPYEGETLPHYTGPSAPYRDEEFDVEDSYSWIKAPRWGGRVMETGPLARLNMLLATGHRQATTLVNGVLEQLGLDHSALYSTLGRTLARNLETKLIADALPGWQSRLVDNIQSGDYDTFNDSLWDPSSWPDSARGVGLVEAPRGALAHYIVIEDGVISNYQAVVPTTWNASPRDAQGQGGPMEMALLDHRVHDKAHPIELLRTIHTFDPCIACAVHLADAAETEQLDIRLQGTEHNPG
jgi:hydrogenase large subunit